LTIRILVKEVLFFFLNASQRMKLTVSGASALGTKSRNPCGLGAPASTPPLGGSTAADTTEGGKRRPGRCSQAISAKV
jgi:hypothetical protein